MEMGDFLDKLGRVAVRRDMLRHPFYQAWSQGALIREDLQEFAKDQYHHVESIPRSLNHFARRLGRSELREAVSANVAERIGGKTKKSYANLWLDFAEGVGAGREIGKKAPSRSAIGLIALFKGVTAEGNPVQVLGLLCAYELQLARVSREQLRCLRDLYGADGRTCCYFETSCRLSEHYADIWRKQLKKALLASPKSADCALVAAYATGKALWDSLDHIEGRWLDRLQGRALPNSEHLVHAKGANLEE
jgi:pyrroloquinoline-quinone synthase